MIETAALPPSRTAGMCTAMRVVAVRFEDGGEAALAAILTNLAGAGRMIIVQAVPFSACGNGSYELIGALHAEMAPYAAMILYLQPTTMISLAVLTGQRGAPSITVVAVPAVDPVPIACRLHDRLGADEALLVEQDPSGLVLQRIRPRRDPVQRQPFEGSSI